MFGAFATHGHVDGYARFVGPNTIVYQGFQGKGTPLDLEEQARMQENLRVLKNASANNQNFCLIEMPPAVQISDQV